MSQIYKKTQIGTLNIVSFLTAIIIILLAPIDPPNMKIFLIVFLLLVLITFFSLTIVITNEYLIFYMGPGLIRKKIPLKDIKKCQPAKHSIWRGWGIKKIRRGWLFNVTGLKVVEIELVNGKIYQIGSPEPEEVCRTISEITASMQLS